jgi:aspartate ammonia-lyase
MNFMRTESDFIGTLEIPDNVLYGIHSLRAKTNFPDNTPFSKDWYCSVGLVKQAIYNTYKNYKKAISQKYADKALPFSLISDEILDALINAAEEIEAGKHFEHFIVPALQGGAGTSVNMNVNEIISNRALQLLGSVPGNYSLVDPFEHANIYQSTNDVIPTSLKVCVMRLLEELEKSINELRSKVETIEKQAHQHVRIGYTQMQEAVPTSFGRLFSTYNDALSRDWWRVSKCFERIKTVNLGGGAIGTALAVPRYFVFESSRTLSNLSGLPISRSENMSDATSNLDAFVEVSAILKAHAVNIEKMTNDLRLLASDIAGREIKIPQKQAGSSIMPAKVNPVIVEYAISGAHQVYANDSLLSGLCALGCLELNAYLPSIGHALINSLKTLISINKTLADNLFDDIELSVEVAKQRMMRSASICTALIPLIGYKKATELALFMKQHQVDVVEANKKLNLVSDEQLQSALDSANLLKEGYSLQDIF